MTIEEFSNEFDVLYNSNPTIEEGGNNSSYLSIDEYEKSVFLTSAQNALLKALTSGSSTLKGADSTEEVRRYLNPLIRTAVISPSSITNDKRLLDKNSTPYYWSEDVYQVLQESAEITRDGCTSLVNVTPIDLDKWNVVKNNPFRGPSKNRVIRVSRDDSSVELISKYPINTYQIRYIKRPNPIILVDLPDDMSIEGFNEISDCELDASLHRTILDTAVQLAKTRIPKTNN